MTHFQTVLFSILVLAGLTGSMAAAQSAEDIVRWIYTSQLQPGPPDSKGTRYLTAPAQRAQFFSRRLVTMFEANDTYGDDPNACLGFNLDIPGDDFDEREINRTLTITSEDISGRRLVTASFSNFNTPYRIFFEFSAEDGYLRIDDIAGPGWRLSEINCPVNSTARSQANRTVKNYCYLKGSDTLKLSVDENNSGQLELQSWQANGHSCGAQGPVQPISGGWLFVEPDAGPACRLEIFVQQDGGLVLSDQDWGCKNYLCGARAVLDGLRFPRSSQIDCSDMPSNR